jgi:hypothetical protein
LDKTTRATCGRISLTIAWVLPVASTATSSSGLRLTQNTRSASAVNAIFPAWRTFPLVVGRPRDLPESASSANQRRKLVYLALQNAVPQWTRTRNWTAALLAFKTHFGDRIPNTAK